MRTVVSSSQAVSATLPLLFSHVPLRSSSHGRWSSMNFNLGPYNGLELFTNCSSMCLFHMVQSSRNGLLQHTPPMESSVLPGPCSSTNSPWDYSFLQAYPLTSSWCSMGCGGTAASAWSSPQSARESLTPEAPPAPFSSQTLVSAQVITLTYFHSSLPATVGQQDFSPP